MLRLGKHVECGDGYQSKSVLSKGLYIPSQSGAVAGHVDYAFDLIGVFSEKSTNILRTSARRIHQKHPKFSDTAKGCSIRLAVGFNRNPG